SVDNAATALSKPRTITTLRESKPLLSSLYIVLAVGAGTSFGRMMSIIPLPSVVCNNYTTSQSNCKNEIN
ncbi:MAG: hypothetical protein E7I02_13370, partial [Klebsiella grimontii]|nr:hypothetical protein [Klebsiella grimontii]